MIYDTSTEAMHGLERAWLRNRALSNEILDDRIRSTFDYAIRLATMQHITTRGGVRLDVAFALTQFRRDLAKLMETLSENGWAYAENTAASEGPGTLAYRGIWHRKSLVEAYQQIGKLLHDAIFGLYHEFEVLDEYSLQDVLQQKRLVLSLGGGGGTGFVHLALFQWLEELGICPALITGTSIGSLLGYIRSIQQHYDAALTTLKLPGLWQLTKSVRPYFGPGEHGLMGMWRLDFNEIVKGVIEGFGYTSAPRFCDLKIPFGCVSSGIIQNGIIEKKIEQERSGLSVFKRIQQFSIRNMVKHAGQIASVATSEHAVCEVVFGLDSITRHMTVTDAVAFSSLVPTLLNYEMPRHHYRSREIVETIFKRDHLYRLADGGLASNVPVRAAVNAIRSGNYGHENIYALGIDVFAPQGVDGIFYPLEQVANVNAVQDARYADAFVRVKYLLSPLNMAPTLGQLRWLNHKFRKTFDDEMRIVQYAMQPLKSLASLDLIGF